MGGAREKKQSLGNERRELLRTHGEWRWGGSSGNNRQGLMGTVQSLILSEI